MRFSTEGGVAVFICVIISVAVIFALAHRE